MPSQADDDRYFDLKGLSAYSSLSVRTLQRHIVDPEYPLPCLRIYAGGNGRGRVLVSKRVFDDWALAFRSVGGVATPQKPEMKARVAAAVRSMRGQKP